MTPKKRLLVGLLVTLVGAGSGIVGTSPLLADITTDLTILNNALMSLIAEPVLDPLTDPPPGNFVS